MTRQRCMTPATSIREMLVCLYWPAVWENSLVVTAMPIVQQRGSADCGHFAIGTAFQAASCLSCGLKNFGNTSRKTLTLGYWHPSQRWLWEEKQLEWLFLYELFCRLVLKMCTWSWAIMSLIVHARCRVKVALHHIYVALQQLCTMHKTGYIDTLTHQIKHTPQTAL